jgi:hypothetical protein
MTVWKALSFLQHTIKGNIYFSMLKLSAFQQTEEIKNKKENVTVLQQEGTPTPF